MMKISIVIPARYASSRLPGKPLSLIAGRSMLQRVYDIAKEATESITAKSTNVKIEILIATEDKRIIEHAESIGAVAILTSDKCKTGTDRTLEAVLQLNETPDFVINLQGDAPLTPADFIADVLKTFIKDPSLQVVTPVTQLSWSEVDLLKEHKKQTPFSGTTVALGKNNNALWFSKNIIPAIRKEDDLRRTERLSPIYRHIGIYGYALSALKKFTELPPSHYEELEGLEQLRFLENGYNIKAVVVDYKGRPAMSGVDSPEDIIRAEALLNNMEEVA